MKASDIREIVLVLREALNVPRILLGELAYMRNRDDSNATILLGGFLLFFSFLVIPRIMVLGYYIRVVRHVSRDETEPPTFSGLTELFVLGIKASVIWAGYLSIPVVAYLITVERNLDPWEIPNQLLKVFGPGFVSIEQLQSMELAPTAVTLLIVIYLLPASLVLFAKTGTVRSAMNPLVLRSVVQQPKYVPYGVTFLALWTTTKVLAYLPAFIPDGLGWTLLGMGYLVVEVFVGFYLMATAYAVVGRSWPRLTGMENLAVSEIDATESRSEGIGSDTVSSGFSGSPSFVPAWIRSDPDAWKRVVLGGVLVNLPLAIPFGVVIAGYLMSVTRTTDGAVARLPRIGWSIGSVIDGVKGYVIWTAYLLGPVVVLDYVFALDETILVDRGIEWGSIDWLLFGGGLPGGFIEYFLVMIGAVGIVYGLILGIHVVPAVFGSVPGVLTDTPAPIAIGFYLVGTYVGLAAFAHVAHTRSLRSGGALSSLLPVLRSPKYAACWFRVMGLTLLGWVPLAVVNHLTISTGVLDTALQPIIEVESHVLYAGPTSVEAILWWIAFLGSGAVYFVFLVVAAQHLGRTWNVLTQQTTETRG